MEIQELWRVTSQRWRVIAIVTLVCTSLALAWSLAGPMSYRAEGRIIISTSGSLGTASDAYSGEQVAVNRAPTYAQMLRGPEVAERASNVLQGEISAQTIQDSIDARISARLPVVIVTADSPSANDAFLMVFAAERALQQYISEIERPGRDGSLTSVALSGDNPTVSRVGNPVLTTILAALGGLVLGLVLAVYRERTDPIVKDAGQIADHGLTYRGTIVAATDPLLSVDVFRRLAVACITANDFDTNRILVVGTDPECDTSFTGFGLARGLAACGRKVTFIDATLSDSSRGDIGLSDVLEGSRSWSECLTRDAEDTIWQMGAGTAAKSLDALLISRSDEFRGMLSPDPSEHVIIAGPSIVHSSIAVALTAIADCACIVVRPDTSSVADVAEAKLTFEAMKTPVIGAVLVRGVAAHRKTDSTPPSQASGHDRLSPPASTTRESATPNGVSATTVVRNGQIHRDAPPANVRARG